MVRKAMEGVWRRHRKAIVYAVSIASVAGNMVALMGSPKNSTSTSTSISISISSVVGALILQGWALWTWMQQAHYQRYCFLLLSSLRSSLLQYLLLNCILLFILLKSGILARATSGRGRGRGRGTGGSVQAFLNFLEAEAEEASEDQTALSSSQHFAEAEAEAENPNPSHDEALQEAAEPTGSARDLYQQALGFQKQQQQQQQQQKPESGVEVASEVRELLPAPTVARRASIFTIEPVDWTGFCDDDTDDATGGGEGEEGEGEGEEGEEGEGSGDGDGSLLHGNAVVKLDSSAKSNGVDDDNALGRQEFKVRVETYITKFKHNLTMQRQASFTRLFNLLQTNHDNTERI